MVDLAGLERVTVDPDALSDARRTYGRGHITRFFNTYVNDRLGDFHAFGKQDPHAVVLEFPRVRVVVTPEDPQQLVETIEREILGRRREPDRTVTGTGP